jgi:hypothetical protein
MGQNPAAQRQTVREEVILGCESMQKKIGRKKAQKAQKKPEEEEKIVFKSNSGLGPWFSFVLFVLFCGQSSSALIRG